MKRSTAVSLDLEDWIEAKLKKLNISAICSEALHKAVADPQIKKELVK